MDDKWARLEEIVRRVVREEIAASRKPARKYEPSIRLEGRIWVGISEEQMEAWRSAYPSVDVESELRKSSAWILSNPSDAPRSQFGRFINSWLARTQNGNAMKASAPVAAASRLAPTANNRDCSICGKHANLRVDSGEWRCLAHRYADTMLRAVK